MVPLDESSPTNIDYDQDSKPPTTPISASSLVEQLYGFKVQTIRELNAYDDRNYYVQTDDPKESEYVLKITNSVDTAKDGILEGQNEMLLHLSLKGFSVPSPVKTMNNSFITRLKLSPELPETSSSEDSKTKETGRLFAIRLLKWIPGKRICDVQIGERQLEQAGDLLARMKNALNGYENKVIRQRQYLWQLENVPAIRQHLHLLEKPRQLLVERCLQDFQNRVLSIFSSLPQSYNHGDFNEQNILVRDDDQHDVFGIIDFGDICYGPRMFDVALLITYCMMLKFDDNHLDPIRVAPGVILRGYLKHCCLNDNELAVIVACVRARFCQSLVLGAYSYSLHPENDYLIVTAKVGWNILEQIGAIDDRTLLDQWLSIAKSC